MTTYPWERQPGESTRAWAAFLAYRDLPARERSVEKLLRDSKIKGNRHGFQDLCHRHHWVERADAWDIERDRVAREAEMEALAKARREEVEALARMRQEHLESAKLLHSLGRQEAVRWLARLKQSSPDQPTLKPREIRELIDAAIRLERLSRGEPDSITETQHADAKARLAGVLGPLLAESEAASLAGESDPPAGA